MPRRFLPALRMSALAVALTIAIAACGSSSSTSSNAAAGTSVSSSGARYQARLQLAKCLRSHGVNVPDPSPGAGPAAAGGGGGAFRALRDNPNFRPALQACAKYRRQAFAFGSLTPAQRAQFQQDLVKFAQCMRAHNINVPDPTTSAGGGFGIFRQIPQSQRSSPAFQSALKTCSTDLPFRPRGPAGAAATPGA